MEVWTDESSGEGNALSNQSNQITIRNQPSKSNHSWERHWRSRDESYHPFTWRLVNGNETIDGYRPMRDEDGLQALEDTLRLIRLLKFRVMCFLGVMMMIVFAGQTVASVPSFLKGRSLTVWRIGEGRFLASNERGARPGSRSKWV